MDTLATTSFDKNLRAKGFTRRPDGIIVSTGSALAGQDFMETCKALAAETNITLSAAIQKLAHERPELHKNWLKSLPARERPSRPAKRL